MTNEPARALDELIDHLTRHGEQLHSQALAGQPSAATYAAGVAYTLDCIRDFRAVRAHIIRAQERAQLIAEILDLIRDDNRYQAWLASLRMPGMLPGYEDIDREMIATYLRDTLGSDSRA